jgi:hypothetical protein
MRITPSAGCVRTEVEDDFHHMMVTLRHADGVVQEVLAEQVRAPWTTCGGAIAQLARDFNGMSMQAAQRAVALKPRNCTHLYDLLALALAHADDRDVLVYDVLASDPIDSTRQIELRKGGVPVLRWVEKNGRLIEPAELAGLDLLGLRDWIRTLPEHEKEAARVLQWGARIANGRTTPYEQQSNASTMPLSCYTFQPHIVPKARRTGDIRDFSTQSDTPLDGQDSSRLQEAR